MPGATSANGYADTHAPDNDVWAVAAGTLHGSRVRGVVHSIGWKQHVAELADEFGDVS
jgi:hypothetical protein